MDSAVIPAEPCRSCNAPVLWCETTLGKSMPVDAEPSPDGNLDIEDRPGRTPLVRVLSHHLTLGREDLNRSHFVTCPQADRWRRGRTP